MTTLDPTRGGHYGLSHAVRSELLKLTSLRSTLITLGGHARVHAADLDPVGDQRAASIGEYASGSIRTTLTALPRRPVLLAAKLGVTATALIGVCQLLSFIVFFIGEAILSGGGAPSATLASDDALRAVVLTGLGVPLMALMAFGFGLIFRSTAGAIASFVGVMFVLPLTVHSFWVSAVPYLPTNILAQSLNATLPSGGGPHPPLPAGTGLAMLAAYALVPLVIGSALFLKHDA